MCLCFPAFQYILESNPSIGFGLYWQSGKGLWDLCWEPHRRRFIRGVSDHEQTMSALPGIVCRCSTSLYISMSSHCKGICWSPQCQPVLCTGGCYYRGNSPGCQEKICLVLLCKLKGTMAWEGGRGFPRMRSAQCAMGKSIWGLSHAICKLDSQHLKGCKIYSLSLFLFFILLY